LLRAILCFPVFLFGSMLAEAESLSQRYAREVAKRPPPSAAPQTQSLLSLSSTWLSIDLATLAVLPGKNSLDTLADESLWQNLQEIGFDGVWIQNLKRGGAARTGFGIDPKWGGGWANVRKSAEWRGIALIGDSLGAATGIGPDFQLALQNASGYGSLYHLIEIDAKDWKLLPKVPVGRTAANVPWLKLEELYKKGYVPESSRPYGKKSDWNATVKIQCADGVERRWIYLKENQNRPLLSWLSPSFAADRIASADALDSIFQLGEKALRIDAKVPLFAKETASLWIRKIGGYSIAETGGALQELKEAPADLALDAPTQPALLHALIAEDAAALRLIYSLYLQEGISPMRLLHALQPYDTAPCDWREFVANPQRLLTDST